MAASRWESFLLQHNQREDPEKERPPAPENKITHNCYLSARSIVIRRDNKIPTK